jgi:T-complex protein 1 subunit eta
MQNAFQPQIILLREGTDTSQGKSQIVSNMNACMAVAEVVRTTLGPRGMDKLMNDGRRTTISNDGATIMRLLDIVHPAAKTLVDISMAQVCSDFLPLNFLFIHDLYCRMLKLVTGLLLLFY